MYYISGVVFLFYVIMGLLAYRRKVPAEELPEGGRILMPFYRMGHFLAGVSDRLGKPVGNQKVQKQLKKMNLYGDARALARMYIIKKLGIALLIVLLGTIFGCLLKAQASGNRFLSKDGFVERGDYTRKARQIELEARMEDSGEQSFQIEVKGRIPDRGEANLLEAEFWETVCDTALGENLSFEEVWKDLNLVTELEGYPFTVDWNSSRPDILDIYGWVAGMEDGKEEKVCLTAEVCLEEWEWIHELWVTIISPPKTEAERQHEALQTFLTASEEQSRSDSYWELPAQWEGENIEWNEKREDNSIFLWLLAVAAALAVFFLMDQDLGKKLTEREQRMKDAYPAVVNKLVLYLGAGMNVRGALEKIVEKYAENLKHGKSRNPAYEELLFTFREMQAGVSERSAYEHLGKRSDVPEYLRFGAILSQNLKKGNGEMLERLREEADRSRREQMGRFRQKGETASTKLLVPMVMMLGVVMVMIMIPAFGSF